ncbi:protein LIM2 [Phoenix dactylifera]|uniref:Protein LIM2 n=1 Tax=Phoenix dactylifera TaxID=42345 RepID=A0A8B7BXC4_PHODC|nr:protein LIM2 [Phoenix dactylifera]
MEIGAATCKTARARVSWLVMLLLAAGLAGEAAGQVCTSTFFSALLQLTPCRPAVTPFSPAPPSEACCNAVKTLGQPCLCQLVNGPPITGVDRNMAMQLPGKCTVNFEPCTSRV